MNILYFYKTPPSDATHIVRTLAEARVLVKAANPDLVVAADLVSMINLRSPLVRIECAVDGLWTNLNASYLATRAHLIRFKGQENTPALNLGDSLLAMESNIYSHAARLWGPSFISQLNCRVRLVNEIKVRRYQRLRGLIHSMRNYDYDGLLLGTLQKAGAAEGMYLTKASMEKTERFDI